MKIFLLTAVFLTAIIHGTTSPYWLIQEDFIKIEKKKLYEKEKSIFLQKETEKVFGFSDMENPQYVFLYPINHISSLESYSPFREKPDPVLIQTCLNFQIFSLHKLLEKASPLWEEVFAPNKPFLFYAVYDVEIEEATNFENHIQSQASKLPDLHWALWKSLLAGVAPKYVFCISFSTKVELEKWSMDTVLSGLHIHHVVRSKQEGQLKRQIDLSSP